MKLLLDEMYTGLKGYLQALSWDVLTVHDAKLVGACDREIVEYAKKHRLLLVTQDERHADLASLRNVPCILISQTMLTRMIDAELRKNRNHAEVASKMNPSRIFDPAHIAVLESEDRKVWQNPDEVLSAVKLKSDWLAADFGCGSGYFTVLLAPKVKKVYAIDIQKEMLSFVEDKIKQLGIRNVELRLSRPNEIPLEDETVDFLMSVNTLHEFDDKPRMIKEMKRVIKNKGNLLIVDFKKQETRFGPPVRIRVTKEKAISLFESANFALLDKKDLPYHYLLAFTKP